MAAQPGSNRESVSTATTTRSSSGAVEAGLGVALVPPLALFAPYPGVVLRVTDDIVVNRRIVAVVRAGSSGNPR